MKNFFILFLCSLSLVSCRKNCNCPPPAPPKTDTAFVPVSIVGDWQKEYGSISFSKDSIVISYDGIRKEQPYPYLASADTVYVRMSDGSLYAQYGYFISKNNDTLTMFPTLHTTNIPDVYHRVN